MDYRQAEEYINHIQKFTTKNTLEHTRMYLEALGNPGAGSRIIHVAGTNGKGSTCNYLRALLMAQGFHVGMFTSPHLLTMRERIRLDDGMIGEREFTACFQAVYEQTRLHEGQDDWYHPTYFEFLFLMAMVYYGEKRPDYIILETGMGGRLDATNVVDAPVMTIITQIGLDHQQYLGDTKQQIAWEKVGIVKKGAPLIYAKREEETAKILENKAEKLHVQAYPVDKTVFNQINISDKGIDFCYNSRYYNNVTITLSTHALYQAENVSLALRAYELLCRDELMDAEALVRVLAQTCWAGRMEQLMPGVFLDGAHNVDGIEAFLESVAKIPVGGRRLLVFAVVSDKAYDEMITRLTQSGLFDEYMIADLQEKRGMSAERIAACFSQRSVCPVSVRNTVREALDTALTRRGKSDMVYIVGSLYLVGEIKASFSRLADISVV